MAASAKKTPRFIWVILRLLSLGFIVAGGVMSYSSYDFDQNSLYAPGIVVDVEVKRSDDGTSYLPTIAFTTYSGAAVRGQSFLSSSGYNYPIGTKIRIKYDVRDPENIRLDNWFELWGFGIIFLGVGSFMFVIFVILGRAARKKRNAIAPTDQIRDKYVRLESTESAEDHARETSYTPTVRRNR